MLALRLQRMLTLQNIYGDVVVQSDTHLSQNPNQPQFLLRPSHGSAPAASLVMWKGRLTVAVMALSLKSSSHGHTIRICFHQSSSSFPQREKKYIALKMLAQNFFASA